MLIRIRNKEVECYLNSLGITCRCEFFYVFIDVTVINLLLGFYGTQNAQTLIAVFQICGSAVGQISWILIHVAKRVRIQKP